jgi:anaerobic ribonucleoside-triphosphate reductase activating protein
MNIARILYPVETLGPGKRVSIWLCGCSRACKGCSNPELWRKKREYEISVNNILMLIDKISGENQIDGFTITGGEPFEQNGELASLLCGLRLIHDDILVYTGYTLDELKMLKCEAADRVLALTAVLIDGAYIEERNDHSPLAGSDNQVIHVLNTAYKVKYAEYLKGNRNPIQNFTTMDGVVSVGIHSRNFDAEIRSRLN